ncbi:cysteine-rich venom protein [Elysia marginata]|uniref:Cysteine-rich venom protein n=1 Tax=Elysia marginata TaxID=1093978 RepID=A0AAV4JUW4_9GAST|nr:cysteine-rich venom protein [Elysia marginata]
MFCFIIFSVSNAQSGEGDSSQNVPSTCRPEFAELDSHTMCMNDSDRVESFGVSDADKKVIVDFHNKVRGQVEPKATNLAAVIYDENLAEVAQKLAMQCRLFHDKNRKLPSYGVSIGQNLAAGDGSWAKAVDGWFKESLLFKYGQIPKDYLPGPNAWGKIGHYTMMVSDRVHRVGCGYSYCRQPEGKKGHVRYYVCNYAKGQHGAVRPYINGTERCSDCPDSCKDGLCDCKGKLCLHAGSLDLNTCTCTCKRIYSGEDCSVLSCKPDKWWCKNKDPARCKMYSNYPYDCPVLCGKCNATTTTPPPTTTTTSAPATQDDTRSANDDSSSKLVS